MNDKLNLWISSFKHGLQVMETFEKRAPRLEPRNFRDDNELHKAFESAYFDTYICT